MRASRIAVALVLALAGVVWLGQGLGVIAGTFMSRSATWTVIGAACLAAGVAIGGLELRRR